MSRFVKIKLTEFQTVLGYGVCEICGTSTVFVRTETKTRWSEDHKCLRGHNINTGRGLYQLYKVGDRFRYYDVPFSPDRPLDRLSYRELTVTGFQDGILEYQMIVRCDRIFINGEECPHSWCVGRVWPMGETCSGLELITEQEGKL